MRKLFVLFAAALVSVPMMAQEANKSENKDNEGYKFTIVKELPVTPVKNQAKAGTCWDYAGTAFLEAELLRMGKGEYDFSEMYTAHVDYQDRAMAAIRTHGDISFSQGGCFGDVLHCMEKYGLVPEELMRPGAMYRDSLSNHSELSAMTNPMVKAAAGSGNLQSDSSYQLLALKAIKAVHDVYLGVPPERFTYKGKQYTPKSFYESTGLKASDYVQITAFLHYPTYSTFAVESPDNWRHDLSYNVTLDELMAITDRAIEQGYPVGWDSDVSEQGFRTGSRKGFCVLPATDAKEANLQGSDMAHWTGMSAKDIQEEAANRPTPQRWVTPEERQLGWDNHETNDDHLMLIYGTAKDQLGNEYYMVKNSWGAYGEYKGMFFASKAYFRYKTITILIHKDALSKEMKKKLGIK
ncbi:MAG: aminopeptidase [Bacteroidales bacterium]|nr:aminopeptidase [Bacteroidales bacterium]